MAAVPFNTPAESTAPVANTTAGLWTPASPARCVIITNQSGQTVWVRLNTATAAAAAVGSWDFQMANNAEKVILAEDFGLRTIDLIGVWFPALSTVANFNIRAV